jgi:hypothetical protein
VPPRRLTGGPRLLAATLSLARSPSLSLTAQWGRPVGAGFFTRAPLLCLYLKGPVHQLLSRCPVRPLFSLCVVGLSCQIPPRPRRAHVAAFLGYDARPRAQLPS